MKTLLLLIVTAGCAFAQTNLGTITFTNNSGGVVRNALVTKSDGVKLTYRLEGGGGTVKLVDLPRDIQQRFGYDANRTVEFERQELASRRAAAARAAAYTQSVSERVQREALIAARNKTRDILCGPIIQRMTNGVLLRSEGDQWRDFASSHSSFKSLDEVTDDAGVLIPRDGLRVLNDFCLLTDFARLDEFRQRQVVGVLAYPIGTHTYITVFGDTNTIPKYTADLKVALQYDAANRRPATAR